MSDNNLVFFVPFNIIKVSGIRTPHLIQVVSATWPQGHSTRSVPISMVIMVYETNLQPEFRNPRGSIFKHRSRALDATGIPEIIFKTLH